MSHLDDTNDDSEHEFLRRVLRYQEKSITPEELTRLNEDLRDDPDRLTEFSEICETSRLIYDDAEGKAQNPSQHQSRPHQVLSRLGWGAYLGLAALLAIFLGLGVMLGVRDQGDQPWGDAVAKLEYTSADAVFSDSHQMPSEVGSLLGKGWVHLDRGTVRILFRSGASVELSGQTAFGIDSPMRSYLEYGRASVFAPDSARDFIVATEGVEIVDLGTRFEVEVDAESKQSTLTVTEGLVDLHLGSKGTPRRIQPLEAGFSAQVDAKGEIIAMRQAGTAREVTPKLLGHWKLDGSIDGVAGTATHLGASGSIDLSDHLEAFTQADSFTISAWVRNPADGTAILFSLSDGTLSNRLQIQLSRRFLVFGWQQGLHFDSVTSGLIDRWEPDRWYHVTVTSRDGLLWLYRDGEQIGSSSIGQKLGTPIPSFASLDTPTSAFLGKRNITSGERFKPQYFGGSIDDLQIYQDAISPEGIRFLYTNPGDIWSAESDNQ